MSTRTGTASKFIGLTAAAALALTACGGGDDAAENGDAAESSGTITLGIIPSWTDGLSMAYLWQAILEDEGYEVEIEEINDAAPLYTGVAQGDLDVYPSAWPEVTHAEYMEEYGDDLEDLGAYYEGAVLTLAVPAYTEIDSIEELPENAEDFNGQVIGIEPGSGHMGVTANDVFPAYELDADFELVESSTAAMLTELGSAIDAEEDIVVTLWRPFYAYGDFDLKDLEDPEGALGEPETLNFIANSEFSGEFPDVAEWMGNFTLSDEEYAELEDMMVNEYADNEEEGAAAWMEDNAELIDSLKE
ncbi:glycine betaine ABC transporter substrate-binding protein [Nesterenkonia sp. E16_7]|uniref:glycine betaine ABC transporter substrate-binding protein n=1 Tax=unclassified Nesterenkonia TaxID=2629769 RepID=UPI001A919D3D|nr:MULTISPECIES: glycine betaine ABC transporter substrate-binding protein [unclassified Nesterenkonia]MBO0594080.1 glycine betaine ABC transporter substrate-binding protein [Nesterenkonia sp. E16_10]MBO0597526.1 glycine betaine ABC transporter substrate-binding protein [Nesterenkonia sp. E16_7]